MSLGGKYNEYGTAPKGITDKQCQEAYEELKRLVADLLPWEQHDPNTLNEEAALIKFLIAQRYDAVRAGKAMREYAQWRKDFGTSQLLTSPMFPTTLAELQDVGFGGHDREGHPLHLESLSNKKIEQLLKSFGPDEMFRWHVYVAEWQQRLMKYWGAKRITVIVDLKDVNLSILSHLSVTALLKRCAIDDSLHYPETKRRLFFINAPMGTSKFWKMFSVMLDRRVTDKVHIWSAKEWKEKIVEFIDFKDLPAELGGSGPHVNRLLADPTAYKMPEPPALVQ